ncbi:MAG: hypothetical protein JJE30_18055 [Desulfuromonadales bacterium]|nr:hypothetical protein [Desulfuromonadales bacterium]
MKAFAIYASLWALLSLVLPLESMLLPDCFNTLRASAKLFIEGHLLRDLAITAARTFVGVAGALIVGGILGIGIGRTKFYRDFVSPALDFIRSIPVAMLFPLFIILSGIGEISRFFMVLTLATPILIISVASGLNEAFAQRDLRIWFDIHKSTIPRWVPLISMAWTLMPGIISGVKSAISLGLVMVVVSEMLFVSSSGVGYAAYQAYNAFNMPEMYAYILITGMVGFSMNVAFDRVSSFFYIDEQSSIKL